MIVAGPNLTVVFLPALIPFKATEQSSISLQLTLLVNCVKKSPQTRQHFIAECQTLRLCGDPGYRGLHPCWHIPPPPPGDVTQLTLDSSVFLENKFEIDLLELYSRELISSLHQTSTQLQSDKERQQSLAVPISKFTRVNFSKQQKTRNQIKKSTSNWRFTVK